MISCENASFDDTVGEAGGEKACAIAEAGGGVEVAKEHEGSADFEDGAVEREAGDGDGVEVLDGVGVSVLLILDLVGREEDASLAGQRVEDLVVDGVDVDVAGSKDGTTSKVGQLLLLCPSASDVGVDGGDEGGAGASLRREKQLLVDL